MWLQVRLNHASIELIKNEKSNYTGAIILARGTNLLNNFKNEG
jgi:hypothetical protein